MNKKTAIILINYKNYAEKYLSDCIESIKKQDYGGELKIFIVDNETSEESFNYLKDKALEADIIRNKDNDGFAKGNNDGIKRALEQGFNYIVLFNLDTVIEKDCVSEMVKVVEDNVKIGAVQARLMLNQDKGRINSLGNVTHFLGFGYSEGYNLLNPKSQIPNPKNICYPSGAAVLLKADVLKEVGLFDEEFWMYNEDQDLGWRIWLAGYKCVLAPRAVVYHKYEFNRSIKKYYWMDRNRILSMLKNYHWMTLVLITPACLIMELGLFIFSLSTGWFQEKLKVYNYFLSLKNWKHILDARKKAQKLRKAKDRDIVKMFSGRIWYQEVDDVKLRLINPVFDLYWWVARFLIKW